MSQTMQLKKQLIQSKKLLTTHPSYGIIKLLVGELPFSAIYHQKIKFQKGRLMMKKLTAILLAVLMVAFSFATLSVAAEDETSDIVSEDASEVTSEVTSEATSEETSDSSDDEPVYGNVALNRPYTYASDDEKEASDVYNPSAPDTGTLLTDGVSRVLSDLSAGGAGALGTTVEFAGTYRVHMITISLDGKNTVDKVVLDVIRRGGNRYCNLNAIEVCVDGVFTKVDFTEEKVPVTDAPQYSNDNGVTSADQFFTLNATFTAVENVTAVRISLDTLPAEGTESEYVLDGARGYIVQLDEIAVYGTKAADSTGDNTSTGDATNTGDAGVVVFAVLAAISLAGVVVAKKVK